MYGTYGSRGNAGAIAEDSEALESFILVINQEKIMKKIQIQDTFSVSEQITLQEIKTLAEEGVKVLICNRPDGEEPNQISCAEIKAAAEANGINFVHIPVPGREIPDTALQEFIQVIDGCKDKIHAYCRTGTRSSIFWGLSHARTNSTEKVLAKAESLGINLTPVADQIEKIYQKHCG